MNKKGITNFLPYILVGVTLVLVFAILTVPMAYVSDEVLDELKESDNIKDRNTTVERIGQVQSLVTPAFDQLVFILLFAIVIGTLVVAIFSDFHPITLIVFVIGIILIIIITGLMANVHDDIMDEDLLENKSEEFTFSNVFMGKRLPVIIAVMGILSVIIIMAKRGRAVSPV